MTLTSAAARPAAATPAAAAPTDTQPGLPIGPGIPSDPAARPAQPVAVLTEPAGFPERVLSTTRTPPWQAGLLP